MGVHNLIHLVDSCKLYGALDTFSAFPFESFLGQIKKLVRSSYRPFEQICNRIYERYSTFEVFSTSETPSPKLFKNICGHKYYAAKFLNFTISSKRRADSCVLMKNNDIVVVKYFEKINGNVICYGQKLVGLENFYEKLDFSMFHFFKGQLESKITRYNISDISSKMVRLPYANTKQYFVCSLNHTL